jgi:lysophospholipase L1-like esterase
VFLMKRFFLFQILFSVVVETATAQTVGLSVNDQFSGTSLQTFWRQNNPSAIITVADKLQVQGGDSSFQNFIEYKQKRLPYESLLFQTSFVPHNKTADSYGLSIYADSDSILYGSSFEAGIDLSTGANSGRISLSYNKQLSAASSALLFTTGDTIDFKLERKGWVLSATAYNRSTSQTVIAQLESSSGRGSGGYWRLVFLGGEQDILSVQIGSEARKRKRTVVVGNSITAGAGATVIGNRYVNRLFNQDTSLFENIAMPSIKAVDVLRYADEIIALEPQYALISLGTNDRNQFTDTAIFRSQYDSLLRKLRQADITPVLLTLVPSGIGWVENLSPRYNFVINDLAASYGLKVVNINPLLKNGGAVLNAAYTVDQVHPNDSGHILLAQKILHDAPELVLLATLPATYLQLQASCHNNNVVLTIQQAAQEPYRSFVIETSSDALHYRALTTIAGSLQKSIVYSDSSKNPTNAPRYYRVKAVTESGQLHYSAVRVAVCTVDGVTSRLYPNPATAFVVIQLSTSISSSYTVRVYNMAGAALTVPAAYYTGYAVLTTAGLPAGLYRVVLSASNGSRAVQTFIKQ